jgi:hypothetical protein
MPRCFVALFLLCALFWNSRLETIQAQKQKVPEDASVPPLVQVVRRVRLPLYHMPKPENGYANNTEYIGRVFLDRKRHRLLVQVRRNYMKEYARHDRFYWIADGKARPCKDWNYGEQPNASWMDLIAADLNRGELYYESSSGLGNGAFLHVVYRNGEQTRSEENPAHLITLVNGRQAGHEYRSFNDYYTDVSQGGWVGEYQNGNLLKRYDVHDTPFRLLRGDNSDTVLMIHLSDWQPLNGTAHPYPKVTILSEAFQSPVLKILNVSRFASTFPHRERFSCSKVRVAHVV